MFNAFVFMAALVAPEPAPRPALVAGIDLGAKGARGVVLGMPRAGAPQVLWTKSLDPTPLANRSPDGRLSDDAIARSSRAVGELARAIRAEFDLPEGRLLVVAGGALSVAGNRDALAAAVRRETGLAVQFLSTDEEVVLAHSGLVPAAERYTAMCADIGSGGVRVVAAGWARDVGEWRVCGGVATGTFTLAERAVDAARPRSSWVDGLAVARAGFAKELSALAEGQPTLVHHRTKCYLTGGAVWALAATVKPGAVRDPLVSLSVTDIDALERALAARPGVMPEVDFGSIVDPSVRAEAETEWRRVRDTFGVQQLAAGCAVLRELSVAYRLDRKELVFVRDGQFAGLTALLAREAAPPEAVAVPGARSCPCQCPRSRSR